MGDNSGVMNCINSCKLIELIPAGSKEKPRLLFLSEMVFGSSLLCHLDWLMHQLYSRDLWSRC